MKLFPFPSTFILVFGLVGVALAGCGGDDDGGTSTSATSTGSGEGGGSSTTSAGDGGSVGPTGSGGSGGVDPSGNGGSGTGGTGTGGTAGSGGSGGEALTGDLWVDFDGEVIGRYGTTYAVNGDTVEGLLTLDQEVLFGVTDNREDLFVARASFSFYASDDCSGDVYLADAFDNGALPEDVVVSGYEADGTGFLFAVPLGYLRVPVVAQSVYSQQYGCTSADSFGAPPANAYPLADMILVDTVPSFTPPLRRVTQ